MPIWQFRKYRPSKTKPLLTNRTNLEETMIRKGMFQSTVKAGGSMANDYADSFFVLSHSRGKTSMLASRIQHALMTVLEHQEKTETNIT